MGDAYVQLQEHATMHGIQVVFSFVFAVLAGYLSYRLWRWAGRTGPRV